LPLACAILLLAPLAGCYKAESKPSRKVFVLGCDGMDPKLLTRLMADGRMPNFSKLASKGAFVPLETSIPPQSPVAWSNFISGADSGVHGIFDFLHRDPADPTYMYLSTNRIITHGEATGWQVGSYVIPFVDAENRLMRGGVPFWEYLDARGIKVDMYHMPANYPPTKSDHGHACCLSGMGVPDATGSLGMFQHFSTLPRAEVIEKEGCRLRIRKDSKTGLYSAKLRGPTNEFRPGTPVMTVDLHFYPDKTNPVAKIAWVNEGILGDEPMELVLNVGEWSEWKEISFLKTPLGPTFRTMAKFYLQRLKPDIELYVTPLNFVPTAPEVPISEPEGFVKDIAEAIGPFYTQSFAENYNARTKQVFTDDEYLAQANQVLDDSMRMLDYALDRYRGGLLFFYFSSTDLQAHIFWWDSQEKHPFRSREEAARGHRIIEDLYVRIDDALGRSLARIGDDATVIVMSDHGFAPLRRCFALNTWLRQEGYLSAKRNLLVDCDWSRTRAYGLGLNALYLNLRGREKDGIVEPGQREALVEEIRAKLLAVRDPQTGKPVIRRVYRPEEIFHGPEVSNAPDLIVGYDFGYRASWATTLGEFDRQIVSDNHEAWSADHCIAHDLVPGILVTNRKLARGNPTLVDLAPTILAEFGVERPAGMIGTPLFKENAPQLARR